MGEALADAVVVTAFLCVASVAAAGAFFAVFVVAAWVCDRKAVPPADTEEAL